jgi:hypothetical protein
MTQPITDKAEIAFQMIRARMTPEQAMALAYGPEIADEVSEDIRAYTRGRKVKAARRLEQREGGR